MQHKQQNPLPFLLFLFLCFSHLQIHAQADYHVNANTPCTTGCDGTTWAKAFDNLQSAVDAAADNDEIWVAEGTYYPSEKYTPAGSQALSNDNRTKTFLINKDFKIYGGFPNTNNPTMADRDWENHPTLLNGDLNMNDVSGLEGDDLRTHSSRSDNAFTVVLIISKTLLDGFFIQNGNANLNIVGITSEVSYMKGGGIANYTEGSTITNCSFSNNSVTREGGAVYSPGTPPIITNCSFLNNYARTNGGAIYTQYNNNLTITDCSFFNNKAAHRGAGIYNKQAGCTITNCTFSHNTSFLGGGAIGNAESSPSIVNSNFFHNISASGGAIANTEFSNPIITNCDFSHNSAQHFPSSISSGGSGIFNDKSEPTITNCSFSHNSRGGSVVKNFDESILVITNCSFSNNSSDRAIASEEYSKATITNCSIYNNPRGSVNSNNNSSSTITNSILWSGSSLGEIIEYSNGSTTMSYSIVKGGYAGTGNLNQNPCFIDPANDDLRISACSPVRNKGNNSADLDDNGSGTQTIADISTDLEGNPRILQTTVDIGAYESIQTSSIVVQSNSPACSGRNLELSALACDELNHQWTGPANFTSNEANPVISDVPLTAAGTYSLTVSDGSGCSASGSVTVVIKESPNPSITGDLEYCASDNHTDLAVNTWSSYLWSNNQSTQTIEANQGIYTVTVTKSNGCTWADEVSVTEINPIPTITGSLEYCASDNFTTLDVGSWSDYLWSNSETTQTIEASDGTYTVTVTDSNGCTGTDEVTVTENPPPVPSITGSLEYCVSGNHTLLDAGTWASYLWSNDETSQTIEASKGVYTVTATDEKGCIGTSEVSISETNLMPTITGDLEYCIADNFTILDAGSWATYLWSNNETTQTIEASEGTYRVSITDSQGCTGTNQVTITENANPIPSITGILEYCASSNSTTLDAGTWTSYLWSNDETSQTIEANGGVHTVTVTNTDGCTGTAMTTVTESTNPIPSITGILEYCASDNFTTLDTGDWTTYLWSNDATSGMIEVGEGTYTVTVSNIDGCTGTDEVTVTENVNANPSISGNLEYCTSDNFTTLDAGDWTTYLWSNDVTSGMIEVGEGTYTVTVSNTDGCTGTDEVMVTENANPVPLFNDNTLNNNRIVCSESTEIEYTLKREELNSNGNYGNNFSNYADYDWSILSGSFANDPNKNDGEGTAKADWDMGSAIGKIFVTVTDKNSCQGTRSIEVEILAPLQPVIGGTFEYCRGREATLDAGTYDFAPQTYLWSNGETTQSFSTTAIGLYTVSVTNQEGCIGTSMAEVSATPCWAEAGVLTSNANEICAGGAVEVSATGVSNENNYSQYFFIYTQDNLGNTSFYESLIESTEIVESTASFGGLAAGDYLVCSYNECQNCLPNPSPITTDLDDIYDTGVIQDGCFDIECTSITVPEAFTPDLEGTGQAQENNSTGNNVYIVEVCGGTAPYDKDFTFSGGFASMEEYPSENAGCINYQIVYNDAADWTLTVTDANDCNNEDVVFSSDGLPTNPLPQISGFTTTQETCIGDNDGSISIEVEGGDDSCDEYTYNWSGPGGFSENSTDLPTGSTIDDLASGTYNVTVTDCEGTTTVQTGINVTRTNIGGRGGRGSGGCKTTGGKMDIEASLEVYPSPFGERTMIEFSVVETSNVWLSVYSMDGRKVVSILEGEKVEGEMLQRYDFEATNLESGMYLLELQTESGLRQHQQLVVLK